MEQAPFLLTREYLFVLDYSCLYSVRFHGGSIHKAYSHIPQHSDVKVEITYADFLLSHSSRALNTSVGLYSKTRHCLRREVQSDHHSTHAVTSVLSPVTAYENHTS